MRHVLLSAVLALSACGTGDRKTCERACRNYFTLSFWHKWDPQIEAAPEAERANMRAQKLGELEYKIEQGVDQCATSCQGANNKEQCNCMAAAKTYEEVRACGQSEEEAK